MARAARTPDLVTGAQPGPGPSLPDGFGAALRAARASRGLTLTEASARTRIHERYLEALEQERLDVLPPYPFARGFLRTYAVELGLDPQPLLDRMKALGPPPPSGPIEQARRLENAIVPARPLTLAQQIARSIGIAGLVAGIALALYFAKQLHELSQPVPPAAVSPPAVSPQAAAPAPPAALPPAPAAAARPSPAGPPVAPAGVTTQVTGNGITVDVEATGRSWILVVADNVTVYEAFVTAGERRRWQASGSMMVRVGNAGVVILTVNGRSMGPLGGPGEVVSRTFRRDDAR
jgi:cytoskeletal protein RodZ